MGAPTTTLPGMVIPWTGEWETFARPGGDGLPEFRFRTVPARLGLATRRQLRARGYAPGGQPVAARLVFRRKGVGWCHADLFLAALARPTRVQSPAQRDAWARAMRARRTCHVAGHLGPDDVGYCVPRTTFGGCYDCWGAGRCVGTVGPPAPVTVPDPRDGDDPWAGTPSPAELPAHAPAA